MYNVRHRILLYIAYCPPKNQAFSGKFEYTFVCSGGVQGRLGNFDQDTPDDGVTFPPTVTYVEMNEAHQKMSNVTVSPAGEILFNLRVPKDADEPQQHVSELRLNPHALIAESLLKLYGSFDPPV